MVRVILAETTLPVRIRPRMETSPVKGHFLSMYEPVMASFGVCVSRNEQQQSALRDPSCTGGGKAHLEPESDILEPPTVLARGLLGGGRELGVVEEGLLLVRLLELFSHLELMGGRKRKGRGEKGSARLARGAAALKPGFPLPP